MASSSNPMLKLTAIFMSCILLRQIMSADILQNPDFALPPSNWRANSTSTFFPLNENSTIPGWTFQGTVQYVTAGANLSLPQNKHGILLGQDGKINQTFTANGGEVTYVLTFTLTVGGDNCRSNASLVVSAPDSSAQYSFTGRYGEESWEVYGHQLGSWGNGESVNLLLESQAIDADPNSTCWPVVDTLLLNTIPSLNQDINENLLSNGGFELGPVFPEFSDKGVLLDTEPSQTESALPQWTVSGTVRYINTNHYFIPEGKAAIEIVSGVSAGVQTATQLAQGSNYILEFMLGDANDSCTGDLTVGVAAGSSVQNFTLNSNGTGSARKYSLTFRGEGSSSTPISFQSYTTRQRQDGVFCGPVVDGIVLRASSAQTTSLRGVFLISLLFIAFM